MSNEELEELLASHYSYTTKMQQLLYQWTKYRYSQQFIGDGIIPQITKPKLEYKEEL